MFVIYCALTFKNTFFFQIKKNTNINITREKIMNSIIETVENKLSQNSNSLMKKYPNFWTLKKMKIELSKDILP